MSDLVQRLSQEGRDEDGDITSSNCLEAAERIEALEARVAGDHRPRGGVNGQLRMVYGNS